MFLFVILSFFLSGRGCTAVDDGVLSSELFIALLHAVMAFIVSFCPLGCSFTAVFVRFFLSVWVALQKSTFRCSTCVQVCLPNCFLMLVWVVFS